MKNSILTLEVLTFYHAGGSNSNDCVDWAVELLNEGYDTPSLRQLAGLIPPFNVFEVRRYISGSLSELGITSIPRAVRFHVSKLIQEILQSQDGLEDSLKSLHDLHINQAFGEEIAGIPSLSDFYSLFEAYIDLKSDVNQWYWPEATRENIVEIIHDVCRDWLKKE